VTRVIAGAARGRRLQVPASARPTGDRAREALFSSLAALGAVEGARVLDLYAGSGALGLEALSRGAASVTLVDDDPRAVAVLRANATAVGLPGAEVVQAAAERWLATRAGPPYDLALLDPPYAHATLPLEALLPHLSADAVVVVERSARDPDLAWPEGYEAVRSRRYGEAMLWIAVRDGSSA
jgi:16S rRNA (guanine966-N2)-methyltransferase